MTPYPTQLCGGPEDGKVINRDSDRYYVLFVEPIRPAQAAEEPAQMTWPRRHVYELRPAMRPDRSAYWRYEYQGVE